MFVAVLFGYYQYWTGGFMVLWFYVKEHPKAQSVVVLILKRLRRQGHSLKNSKWVWSGNTTITNRRQPHGTARKSHSTVTRHQEDKLSKATSSLFPIKMIAILEWTQSNVQQNIEQLQTPTMGVTFNKKSTTTEPPP